MTGWGQEGPWALEAGHDINYIALAGALDPCARKGEAPVPPMNLVGDFGGGAMFLAFGVVCGILEARTSGQGQVVDAAMVDGAALLTTMMHGMMAMGIWDVERGTNMLDTGAFFYEVYRTKDDKFVSVGSIEPQFYAALIELTGLGDGTAPPQMDRASWPELKEQLAAIFLRKTRDEWCEILEGHDVCFAPVLSMAEAPDHPHMAARGTFTEVAGIRQPGPAPRFSRTPGAITEPPPHAGQHTDEALVDWGLDPERVAALKDSGATR
jgi:alpha-methylacyl-CoA racemase